LHSILIILTIVLSSFVFQGNEIKFTVSEDNVRWYVNDNRVENVSSKALRLNYDDYLGQGSNLVVRVEKSGFKPFVWVISPVSNINNEWSTTLVSIDFTPENASILDSEVLVMSMLMLGVIVVLVLVIIIFKKNSEIEDKEEDDEINEKKEQLNKIYNDNDQKSKVDDTSLKKILEEASIPDSIPHLAKGTIVGDYVIDRVIGVGGIATIYLATDDIGKKVAVKLMSQYIYDKDLIGKFYSEGALISDINTRFPEAPIVKCYRTGTYEYKGQRVPFIALEYIQGETLKSWMKKTSEYLGKIKIIEQIADALNAVHSMNAIHRDISPENILFREMSSLEIAMIDFGVARFEIVGAKNKSYGAAYGKPEYMAPEQFDNANKVDYRTDYYSLGVLIYEMFVGKPPFRDPNIFVVGEMHKNNAPPDVSEYVPTNIQNLIRLLLAKNPENRPSSIDQIKTYLK